jgi:hypothetical protein
MSKVVKKIAAAVAVVAAIVFTGGTALAAVATTIGKALVTAAVSIGISRLVAKRSNIPAEAGGDGGGRVQLPPATTNKLPVVYGTSFIGGAITDAMLSTDQKTMWYVVALAEVSDDQGGGGGSYTFDTSKFYYDGKNVQFGIDGAVTGLITNTSTPQVDTRCNGFLYIYTFVNGSGTNVNNNHPYTAQQILSTTNGVPAAQAWSSSQAMTNCAFAIVRVIYSTDAGTTGAGSLTVNITNSITKPGDAILDYMLNNRYGCNLPLNAIDTTSLTDLNTYSDDLIDYKPVGWNTGDPYSQQSRYRINGPVDTGQNCLNNLQFLVDSCDSWLQYSELSGKWRVVMNKGYDQAPNAQTINQLFSVDSSNLVGGIEVSPIDLNETFNEVEVGYPNTNIKDQTDYQIIDLFLEDPQLLSANEAVNRLNLTLPHVNNAVQAKYLAARRLYQSREDLVIAFKLDFSGIQIEAGDVIRVTHEVYGWTDKLFRVSSVAEEKDASGNLFAAIQAFEYSNDIYDDIIQDYVPAFNTGLIDPNVISQPGTPTITTSAPVNGQITSFDVTSYVPDTGLVLYMDFNYGNSSNVLEHRLYRTIQQSNGAPYINSDSANAVYTNVSVNVNDLVSGNYYWSVTARNNTSGKRSNSSGALQWFGANVVENIVLNGCNATSNGNAITSDVIANLQVGSNVFFISGTGELGNNTYVTNVISNTSFTITPNPITPLSNACLQLQLGGVRGNQVQSNTVTYVNVNDSANPASRIVAIGFSTASLGSNTTQLPIEITTAFVPRPVYLDGTNIDPNYYNPYFQGTSTTANGYSNNSTAPYAPAFASFQTWQEGDDGYYSFIYTGSNISLANNENLQTFLEVTLTSNVDTIIQLIPFYAVDLSGNLYTQHMTDSTYIIMGNTSYQAQLNINYNSADDNPIIAAGFAVRNTVANSRLTIPYAFLDVNKARFPQLGA